MKKVAVVTTTIRVPEFLKGVSENAARYEKQDISFYIIGDKKTPNEAIELCNSLEKEYPYSYNYYSLEDQEKRLSSFQSILKVIPYNTGVRKLLGNFIAYQDGYENIIQLDDDNFVGEDDFFGGHSIVGNEIEMQLIQSESGWYNIYEPLIEESGIPFFPRGYPWSKREYVATQNVINKREKRKVVLVNGLVYEDPDIDAISRLFWPIRVVGIQPSFKPNFGLYPGTWGSFNNQNTSISKELAPIYFTPYSGARNSDIWTSFVICKLVEQMGDVVAFGSPFVKQFRNPHNLWKDLEDELTSNKATDTFVSLLRSIDLQEKSYMKLLHELIEKSLVKIASINDMEEDQLQMIHNFFSEYKIWANLFDQS